MAFDGSHGQFGMIPSPSMNRMPIARVIIDNFQANVIKLCYDGRVNTIGLGGNVSDSFITSISLDDPISAILLYGGENSEGQAKVLEKYRISLFAFTASTSTELEKILVFVKNSKWWNHMAQFYAFDSPAGEIGCGEAFGFLWTAWRMNILGAKFICHDETEGPLIYAFNPFSQEAPAPWKVEPTRSNINNHSWTLLVREFHSNVNICETIDFDQTRDTSGFELRLTMLLKHKVEPAKPGQYTKLKFGNKILNTIARYMNVSFKMVYNQLNESSGDTVGNSLLQDLTDGRSDVVFHVMPFTSVSETIRNYPILNMHIFAVTHYTSFQTQWRKVISAIDGFSRIGLCVVIVVNIIFLKYAFRQTLVIAILNSLRIICNSCFTDLPNRVGPRIYLTCLFGFALTMQALYQGQLSATLTKRVRYPNVNNAEDLINSDHVFYGRFQYGTIFNDPIYGGRFVGIDDSSNKCLDYILENSSVACVGLRHWLVHDAIEGKLHMSKNSIGEILVM